MKPFKVREAGQYGGWLTIEPEPEAPGARVIASSYVPGEIAVTVSREDVPGTALALYEAAGLPEPVILDAPTMLSGAPMTVGVPSTPVPFTDDSSLFASGGRVFLRLDAKRDGFTPDEARKLGAALALHAAAAEGQPGDEAVQELALAIHAANCADGSECNYAPTIDDRNTARAILLAGWKREPQA